MITTDPGFNVGDLATGGKNVALEVHTITNPFEVLEGRNHISAATFMRFVISDYVDMAHRRVLYLDADTVVLGDLTSLFEIDLRGAPVAAVPDYPLLLGGKYWSDHRLVYAGREYGIVDYMEKVLRVDPSKNEYISCGVLLIDLREWKRICEASLAFIMASDALCYLDQDALSYVVKGNFIRLPPEYNAQSDVAHPDGRSFRQRLSGYAADLHRIIRIWRRRAKIVHFTGPDKPWLETSETTGLEVHWWRAARKSKVFGKVAHLSYKENCKPAPKIC